MSGIVGGDLRRIGVLEWLGMPDRKGMSAEAKAPVKANIIRPAFTPAVSWAPAEQPIYKFKEALVCVFNFAWALLASSTRRWS